MAYDTEALAVYRNMVEERFLIWQRRMNDDPPPWTTDPILSNLKMTNMFRILDPGSQFVFQLADEDPVNAMARLVFYRVTNLPATWYALRSALGNYPLAGDFVVRPEVICEILSQRREAGNRIFSGAYIIVPEPGTKNDKMEGAVRLTQRFVEDHIVDFLAATSQDERFAILKSTPGLGKFLSMQILTDWGYLQKNQPDLSFIVAGPGATRGAAILNPDVPPETVIYELYDAWADSPDVRLANRPLTVMDVQNTMCEWSKYAREMGSPRKKSLYKPAHPGAQPKALLPQWW